MARREDRMARESLQAQMLRLAGAVGAAAAIALALAPPHAGAERPRGAANSADRTLWCRGQLSICLNNGFQSCDQAHPSDTSAASTCYEGVQIACDRSFGSASDCRTQARTPLRASILTAPRAPVSN